MNPPDHEDEPDHDHDHSSIDLPDVLTGEVGRDQLEQCLSDIESCATILSVQVRYVDGTAPDSRTTLAELRTMLEGGQVRTAQLRYRYQDQVWCDTVMMTNPGSIKLVRIQQDAIPTSPSNPGVR